MYQVVERALHLERGMKTLKDLMSGYLSAEILCAFSGTVVRRLVVCDDTLDIDASGPWGHEEFSAPLAAEIKIRPWFMDRGDILFTADGQTIKLCTEHDLNCYEDGTTMTVSL